MTVNKLRRITYVNLIFPPPPPSPPAPLFLALNGQFKNRVSIRSILVTLIDGWRNFFIQVCVYNEFAIKLNNSTTDDQSSYIPLDQFFVAGVLNYQTMIRTFQILNTDFELLVNFQPRIVHFSKGSGLFFHILEKKKNIITSIKNRREYVSKRSKNHLYFLCLFLHGRLMRFNNVLQFLVPFQKRFSKFCR